MTEEMKKIEGWIGWFGRLVAASLIIYLSVKILTPKDRAAAQYDTLITLDHTCRSYCEQAGGGSISSRNGYFVECRCPENDQ